MAKKKDDETTAKKDDEASRVRELVPCSAKEMKEYKIELFIDEGVLKDIDQEMVVKRLTGNLCGIHDEFLLLILMWWKKGKTKLHITEKEKKREKDNKTEPKRQNSIGSKQTKGWIKVIKESSGGTKKTS